MQVTATGDYAGTAPQVTTATSGTTTTVSASCSGNCDLHLKITVPAALAVRVQSGAAAILADGLNGALEMHTDAGAITVRHPHGDLSLHSGAGGISLTDAASPKADISTSDGGVDAAFTGTPGAVTIATGAGGVDLRVPADGGYRITTHSTGSTPQVDLQNSDGAAHTLSVRTADGGIHIH